MKYLKQTDLEIYKLIKSEEKRQKNVLEMIPSENYASQAVMEATGSVLMNKYSEGYSHKRYYQGNQIADQVEDLAINRAKELFNVPHVNVQPYSGSPANAAIYMATLMPGDTIMGLALSYGGHLTHGFPGTFSGTIFKGVQYQFGNKNIIDFEELEKLALECKPKMIIASTTAYPRIIDFERFAYIADKVGALLHADISHIAGLIVAGVHPSPVPYAHTIMTTTHKTLRGPRGAMIMVTEKGLQKDPDLAKKIDRWIIPGMQGGPHDNTTAAIATALLEASQPEFKIYGEQVVKNAKALAENLIKEGFDLITGGTDNHLILIDLRNKKIAGSLAALALEYAGIIGNKNAVPNDPLPPFYTSGIRLGTPAITTRGMKEKEMTKISKWIASTVKEVEGYFLPEDKEERKNLNQKYKGQIASNKRLKTIESEIKDFCAKYPVP